jgi:hypothetical protein
MVKIWESVDTFCVGQEVRVGSTAMLQNWSRIGEFQSTGLLHQSVLRTGSLEQLIPLWSTLQSAVSHDVQPDLVSSLLPGRRINIDASNLL